MRAEINVTPLIDVMLVLIILFMVLSRTADHAIEASVPPEANGESRGPAHPLVIAVEADTFRLDEAAVPTARELGSRLREVLSLRADRTVFIRVAPGVAYGRVMDAMDEARGADADRIGILPTSGPWPASRGRPE